MSTTSETSRVSDGVVGAAWLREVCLESGVDDVGFVEIGRPALDDQREDILHYFP